MGRPVVVLSLLGTTLDRGTGPKRWDHWRPNVDLCRHEDLLVSRLEIITQARWHGLTRTVTEDIGQVSPHTEVRTHVVELRDPWDFEEVYATLFDFARGYDFRPEHEEYLVHIATGTHVAQICWFLLTEARHVPGRLLQTSPPAKADGGPGTYRLIDLDLSKYDQIASRFDREQREGLSFLKSGIDTKSRVFNELVEQIEHVAVRSRAPVLLTGPTGVGKTRLARRIYELKRQRRQVDGRFVEVNCATLRGDQAMSMLFGHARGAFTGAQKDRAGLLREADRGVLFLDEIGELRLDEQAMLLRALEDKRFLPLGSDREVQSDFQLIAGTNRDLGERVQAGHFRADLLARIDLWTYSLPPLAERPEDIAPNLEYELERFAARERTRVTFNHEARAAFLRFATDRASRWAGNFRDFAAAVERMGTLAPGGRITAAVVEAEIERLRARWRTAEPPRADDELLSGLLGPERLGEIDRFDRVQLAEVVRVCRAARSLSDAGRLLFAASRSRRSSVNDADRLRKYLGRFDLQFGDLGTGAPPA